jgi:hypothetical protein
MKKCKVCNREDAKVMFSTRNGDGYQVVCHSSCVIGPHRQTKEEAEKAWDELMDTGLEQSSDTYKKPVAAYVLYGTPFVVFEDGDVFGWSSDADKWVESTVLPGTKADR